MVTGSAARCPVPRTPGLRAALTAPAAVCVQVRCTRIQEPPNVLTIHLKRFEFAAFGKKINRHVDFPLTLDLRKFMHPSAAKADHMCAPRPAAGGLLRMHSEPVGNHFREPGSCPIRAE